MEEYDYYNTRSDEECRDTMREVVDEFYNQHRTVLLTKDHLPPGYISDREFDLLMEYAPKLFNTLPLSKDLEKIMFEFVSKKVNVYCNNVIYREYYDKNIETKYLYPKKSLKYKADKVRESIDNITGLVPGIAEDLLNALTYLHKNAEKLVYHKPNSVISLNRTIEPVRKYLISLELPNKTNEINSFVNKLKVKINK